MNKKETLHEEETFLTVAQASKFLGYAQSYIYKLIMRREIAYYKIGAGRAVRFAKSDLLAYLNKCRVSSQDELQAKAELNLAMKGGRL